MATIGEKEIKTLWPVEIGTTARTTRQVGKKFLEPELDLVPHRNQIGI